MDNLPIENLMPCPCDGGRGNPLLLVAIFLGSWLVFGWIKTLILKKICGGLVLLGGVWLIYTAP